LALRNLGRYAEALSISREANDHRGIAMALIRLGEDAYARQAYVEARRLYEESLSLVQAIGRYALGGLYTNLGDVALAQDDYKAASGRYQEALAQSRRIHRHLDVLRACERLGRVALAVGDPETAAGHYLQALETAVESHSDLLLHQDALRLDVVIGIALLIARTDEQRAVELAALAREHPSGTEETQSRAQGLLEDLRPRLSPAAFAAAQERGRSLELEATLRQLLALLDSR
jgi:tetratricopeptide (TPR) repeat protein